MGKSKATRTISEAKTSLADKSSLYKFLKPKLSNTQLQTKTLCDIFNRNVLTQIENVFQNINRLS